MAVSAPEYRFPYYRNHGFLVQEYSALVLDEEDMGLEWIQAALKTEFCIRAVGTVFSEDVNSFYTIMQPDMIF